MKRSSSPMSSPVQRKPARTAPLLPSKMHSAASVTAQPRAVRPVARRAPSPRALRDPILACTGLLVVRWNKPPHGSSGRHTFGVGVLIDDTHVLTCAHNVVDCKDDRLTGAVALAATFHPGEIRKPDDHGGRDAATAFFHAAYADEPRAWDIAVVRLAAPIPTEQISRYPALVDCGALIKMRATRQLKMKVHGYKLEAKPVTVTELAAERNALVHNGGAIQGASGSPIYTAGTICGVHASEGKQSFGVGLFDPVLQWILDAKGHGKSRAQFVTAVPGARA